MGAMLWLEIDGGWRSDSDAGLHSEQEVWRRLVSAPAEVYAALLDRRLAARKHVGSHRIGEEGFIAIPKDRWDEIRETTIHGELGSAIWIVRSNLARTIADLYGREPKAMGRTGTGGELTGAIAAAAEREVERIGSDAVALMFFNEGFGLLIAAQPEDATAST